MDNINNNTNEKNTNMNNGNIDNNNTGKGPLAESAEVRAILDAVTSWVDGDIDGNSAVLLLRNKEQQCVFMRGERRNIVKSLSQARRSDDGIARLFDEAKAMGEADGFDDKLMKLAALLALHDTVKDIMSKKGEGDSKKQSGEGQD